MSDESLRFPVRRVPTPLGTFSTTPTASLPNSAAQTSVGGTINRSSITHRANPGYSALTPVELPYPQNPQLVSPLRQVQTDQGTLRVVPQFQIGSINDPAALNAASTSLPHLYYMAGLTRGAFPRIDYSQPAILPPILFG